MIRFAEVNLFGVYVAPISIIMLVAWLVFLLLRLIADHFGFMRLVWHPALFSFAVYVIVLSSIIFLLAR